MQKEKWTLFLSDIHMGAGKKWDWFDAGNEGPRLIRFFEYVSNRQKEQNDIKEIVLLGDVFDLWVCPHNETPHMFSQIATTHVKVFDAIKKMADNVPTLYVNGNHDYQVTRDDIQKAFDGKVKHIGEQYRRKNILGLHGHEYALFNRPDPKNGGPILKLPLGYYITRLHTTLKKSRAYKAHLIFQVIDETFQMMGPEKLPESVFDAMRDAVTSSGGADGDYFEMGHICPNKQKFEDVRKRYRNLYDDWREAVGFWQSTQMIMCELNRLGGVADQLCRNGVEIVVMGHSHDTKMDKDSLFVQNRIYANCGFWCGYGEKDKADDNAHFVQTDGQKVELCSYKNKTFKKERTLEL
ncbi:MAG: hypothetical protein GY850_05255 [bacterium]|nr:hypothetical protein [bacterium]